MATTAGLIAGCLVHTTLLALGISALISTNENLFFGIKLFGAVYLFYLAFTVFRSKSSIGITQDTVPRAPLNKLFRQGFIMNVLNPKVTLFFLAFFPGFLFSDTLSSVAQFYILGALFMLVSFFVFSLIALFSGWISERVFKNELAGKFLKWLQILVFVGIGIYLLCSDK